MKNIKNITWEDWGEVYESKLKNITSSPSIVKGVVEYLKKNNYKLFKEE